jgi:hypothetical protein
LARLHIRKFHVHQYSFNTAGRNDMIDHTQCTPYRSHVPQQHTFSILPTPRSPSALAFPFHEYVLPDFLETPITHLVGSLEGTSSEHPLIEDYSKPTVNFSKVNGESPNGIPTPRMNTRSSTHPRTTTNSAREGTRRSFNLRRAAASLFRPHKKIGRAPGVFRSIRSIITASCMWCLSIVRDREY